MAWWYTRDIKAYDRKIKKAVAKKNKDRAIRLKSQRPSYQLDPLIKQRCRKKLFLVKELYL